MIMERKYEFEKMPSAEFCTATSPYLYGLITKEDMSEIERITKAHGLNYTFINKTFGGDGTEFVLFKEGKHFSEVDKMLFLACVNDLDNHTNFLFDTYTPWNNIERRPEPRTYACVSEYSWETICNVWPPSICDTRRKLAHGDYLIAHTHIAKLDPKCVWTDEFSVDDVVAHLKGEFPNARIDKEVGKRQCDTDREPYECVVVRNSNGGYCGAMEFKQTKHGIVRVRTMRPLCGECEYDLVPSGWREQVADFVKRAV